MTFARRPGCRAAMCRPSGRCSSAAASPASGRRSSASAGTRRTAISSTSTGSAATRRRPCWFSSTVSKARRRATTPRPSPPTRANAAGASPCRTFAAARASSTWRRAPTTPATGRRSAGCSAAFAPCTAGPIVAVGVSLGGNALLRYAEEAGASALERVRAIAAVSAPLDLDAGATAIGRGFGLQVYTRMFLRSMKPKALAQARPAPGPVRRRAAERRRATCAPSTTSSPRRCTAFATPPTTTPAARPSRGSAPSAFRRCCSMRATTRSCPARRCRARTRSAATSPSGSRSTAATSASPAAAGPATSAPCPSRSWGGSTGIASRARGRRTIGRWTRSSPRP